MNENFVKGFEKQAGVGGMLGGLVGSIKKAPSVAAKVVSKAKAVPGKVVQGVKAMKQRGAREFDVMQRRNMGSQLRKSNGLAGKQIDLSNRPKIQPKKPGVIGRTLSTTRDLAAAGTIAVGAGVALGAKDPEQPQSQPRQGY